MIRIFFVQLSLVMLCSCTLGDMKCASRRIVIEGQVSGEGCSGRHVQIQMEPPSGIHQIELAKGQELFSVEFFFDSTERGGRFRHDCSRRPSAAVVRLICDGKTVDEERLRVPEELVSDARGDYLTNSRIELKF